MFGGIENTIEKHLYGRLVKELVDNGVVDIPNVGTLTFNSQRGYLKFLAYPSFITEIREGRSQSSKKR